MPVTIPLPEAEKDYLRKFAGIFRDAQQAEQYLYDFWGRGQVVVEWMDELSRHGVRRVLELGSGPFLLTLLLKRHFDFDLRLANFYGDPKDNGHKVHVLEGGRERHELPYDHFNLESDVFPYEDGSLDAVLFCEILEHLLLSASWPFTQIHRVLRPGGYVVVTTPNVARLGNLVRLARGQNIYDDYSPYGIYGRHNREYTLPEVVAALERHGFDVVQRRLCNIYRHPLKTRVLQALRPWVWYEHIFVMGRKR